MNKRILTYLAAAATCLAAAASVAQTNRRVGASSSASP
jgi:hypothetical protein